MLRTMEDNENVRNKSILPDSGIEHEPAAYSSSGKLIDSQLQSQTKDMEVHAHSHTPRKKWTHYFWEFLMLFLAVFCGFLAEYKLEHVIEHQREKTLMYSLTEDLHADEITLTNYFNWRTKVNADFDSLLLLLLNPHQKINAYIIYQKANTSVLRFGLPDIHEGTIQQLKNAGGLRLVRNKEVLKSINEHYLRITRMKSVYEVEILLRVKLSESMAKVLDAKFLIDKNLRPESFRLASTEVTEINNCMNGILAAKQINSRLITQLDSTLASTIKLNQLIEREYHFL